MSARLPPTPPWRIRLKGVKGDLEDLATCLQGELRIVQQSAFYFLESEALNKTGSLDEVFRQATALLRVISSVARVRRSVATPIELAAIKCKYSEGDWRECASYGYATLTVYPRVVCLAPELFERCVKLALRDERVRINLEDFAGQWDFPRLRRVAELVLLDLGRGDVKRGVQEVVSRGWASSEDCNHFWDSVNYGHGDVLGTHSHLRRSAVQNAMTIIQAGEFLRWILAKWVEEKV